MNKLISEQILCIPFAFGELEISFFLLVLILILLSNSNNGIISK